MRHVRFLAGAVVAMLVASPAVTQEFTGTLQKIKDRGSIVVGHREASVPFAYLNDQQEPVGYSIDICLRVVESVKEHIGAPDLEVEMVPVNPQTRIPLLANGTIDLECGSTTYNLTRDQQIDYSLITYITGTKLLVKKASGIQEIDDLDGKSIALAQGTTNERAVKREMEERGLDIRILNVKDHNEGFLALETDRVDAYSTDDILLYGLIAKSRQPDDYAVVGEFLSYDPYSIMVPPNDSDFRLVVDRTIADLFRSGEIHEIYEKWFGPMGVPMSRMLENAIELQALPY